MTALGFPRSRRVLASADFTRGFADGQRLSTRFFRAHWRSGGAPARLGLAVSRKVDKRAVVRNRIKRCARESFRLACSRMPDGDAVLVARREAAAASSAALRADLASLWQRLCALPASQGQGTMRRGSDAVSRPADPPPPESPPASTSERRPPDAPLLPTA